MIVKVIDSPSTMPSGRRRPPTPPADSSAGSTGSTHGDSAVPAPASTAKPSSTSIGLKPTCVPAPEAPIPTCSVASKSVLAIGPTHGDVAPASR